MQQKDDLPSPKSLLVKTAVHFKFLSLVVAAFES